MEDTNNNEPISSSAAISSTIMIFLIIGFISSDVMPWMGHKLTAYPVVDKKKIISEARYCGDKAILVDVVRGNSIEHHFILPKSHISNDNYQPEHFVMSYVEDYLSATLNNDGRNCTLTLSNKPTK